MSVALSHSGCGTLLSQQSEDTNTDGIAYASREEEDCFCKRELNLKGCYC
jgi:hypothetical protein